MTTAEDRDHCLTGILPEAFDDIFADIDPNSGVVPSPV
jgi:hypothetical protein